MNLYMEIKQNKIDDIEILSFIKTWLKNTNETLELAPDVKIKNHDMVMFYREFLNAFQKNKRSVRIFGVDKALGFELYLSSRDELFKACKDIWDNPRDYYQVEDEDENEYYEFLKFLWIDGNSIQECRLTDIYDGDEEIDFDNI